jgi:polysaccharide transporter, PST family
LNPLFDQIRKSPVVGNFGSLFIIQLMNMVIPLIIMPVLVQQLGIDNYGIIVFAQYFSGFLMVACDYGFVYTGPKQVSQNQENRIFLDRLFSSITIIKLVFLCVSVLVVVLFCQLGNAPEDTAMILNISLLAVAGNVLTPLWFLQGAQRIRSLAIISVIFKLLQLIALIVFIHGRADLYLACWIFFGASFFLGLCSFIYTIYYFKIRFRFPLLTDLRNELKSGFHMFASVFFSSIYIHGTGIFLSLITANNELVGQYGAAEKIVRAVTSMFNPLVQAFFPFISKMFMVNNQMGGMLFFKFLNVILVVTVFTSLMVYLCSGLIVDMMFKPGMEPTILLIGILCPVIVFGNIGNLIGNNLYIQFGWERITVAVMFLAAVINSALCLALIPGNGAIGAAVALTATEMLAALCFFGYYRYKNRF